MHCDCLAKDAGRRAHDPIQAPQAASREASVERTRIVESGCNEWISVAVAEEVAERTTKYIVFIYSSRPIGRI